MNKTNNMIKNMIKWHYSKPCLVCGDDIALTEQEQIMLEHGLSIEPKICDKCKKAILKMREELEDDEKSV